jgi:hypothetical protein
VQYSSGLTPRRGSDSSSKQQRQRGFAVNARFSVDISASMGQGSNGDLEWALQPHTIKMA